MLVRHPSPGQLQLDLDFCFMGMLEHPSGHQLSWRTKAKLGRALPNGPGWLHKPVTPGLRL